jgi:hypothetical protein
MVGISRSRREAEEGDPLHIMDYDGEKGYSRMMPFSRMRPSFFRRTRAGGNLHLRIIK